MGKKGTVFYSDELREYLFYAVDQNINLVELIKSAIDVKNIGLDPVEIINNATNITDEFDL